MSANLNGFSVKILGNGVDFFKRDNYNYFSVPHKGEYKIKLGNNRETKVDAQVTIGGEDVGTWRVGPYSTITLQRPANINRKFTFVAEDSTIAKNTGVKQNSYNNGLISVLFKPAKLSFITPQTYSCEFDSCCNASSRVKSTNRSSSGATILGDPSTQHFASAERITDYDYENISTINLRLVIAKRESYVPLSTVRSTSIPPRVDEIYDPFY
ncbi:MAG: hypothetical protein Hyperionvirus1_11 [Hyperionvirus sp.]|uniref:Uncharacterized protein n=1 Tax=Hyperionvirus sp. TaxID=2487770 RepID=A0A3G5A5Y5_9VIRU|nr:MAG: hypothetical protein Hyperionvirus1_11 [Hyperionvirus sp.]